MKFVNIFGIFAIASAMEFGQGRGATHMRWCKAMYESLGGA